MKRVWFICFLILTLSCGEKETLKRPKDIIPKEQMVDIIFDIYVMNASKGVNRTLLEVNGVNPERYVFDKYDIDSLQFAQNNEYYAYQTEIYEAIVDSVRAKIKRKQIQFDKELEEETKNRKTREDSLQKLKEGKPEDQDGPRLDRKKMRLLSRDSL